MKNCLILVGIVALFICIGLTGCTEELGPNAEGNNDRYDEGYNDGYTKGYSDGYDDGFEDGSYIEENPVNDYNRFVGTWKTPEPLTSDTMIFFSDGSYSWSYLSGNYEIKDGNLVINLYGSGGSGTFIYSYVFSNDDNILTLMDINTDKEIEYVKQ